MPEIQSFMQKNNIDCWLIADFAGRNPIFKKFLGGKIGTRRAFLVIPKRGRNKVLISKVDFGFFKPLKDIKILIYSSHKELKSQLKKLLKGKKTVAMEYSFEGSLPQISYVDGGTVDLIKSFNKNIISSADLIGLTNSWSKMEVNRHLKAAKKITKIKDMAFNFISLKIRQGKKITDYQVKLFILKEFKKLNLETDFAPIVAVDKSSSDPHYLPSAKKKAYIKKGSWILIDLWAKEKVKGGIFADITWVGYVGRAIPEKYLKVFEVVIKARDKALKYLEKKLKRGEKVFCWQVDKVARSVIKREGFGKYFIHSLGHSLGEKVHAESGSFNSLGLKDTRRVIPGHGYTIEPGIYLKAFGVRSEIDIFIDEKNIRVTTPVQDEILLL